MVPIVLLPIHLSAIREQHLLHVIKVEIQDLDRKVLVAPINAIPRGGRGRVSPSFLESFNQVVTRMLIADRDMDLNGTSDK